MEQITLESVAEKLGAFEMSVNAGFERIEARLSNVETRLTDVESSLTNVETRLTDVETRLTRVENRLLNVEIKLIQMESKIDEIDKSTAYLPKLYDIVDKFMGEINESRQERTFINNRLTRLEKAVAKQA